MNENDPAHVPIKEYIEAHSVPNGGFRAFLRSNLFTALVMFFLGQCFVVGGTILAMYWRTSALVEWKGNVDATIKRMDEQGTTNSHYSLEILRKQYEAAKEELVKENAEHDARLKAVEKSVAHEEVQERDLTLLRRDVDEVRSGRTIGPKK